VVCPDLRGYGGSTVPPDADEHAQASKRAMGSDVAALMTALGHERFASAGHDRGGYAAFRTAGDHPERIAALTTMGRAVPIIETLERMDSRFAREWWHWFFLGQTGKPAEDLIAAVGPDAWYGTHGPEVVGAEAHADVWAALRDPAVVHGMCEDYRAGLPIDVEHDRVDRGDPLALLRGWADDLRGAGIDSGHHVAEEAPEATAAALAGFWRRSGGLVVDARLSRDVFMTYNDVRCPPQPSTSGSPQPSSTSSPRRTAAWLASARRPPPSSEWWRT
jgi:haloacetate dehalogenase